MSLTDVNSRIQLRKAFGGNVASAPLRMSRVNRIGYSTDITSICTGNIARNE